MQEPQHAPKLRVLLADDHGVVRDGIRRLLQNQDDIEVVGLADDGLEAVEMAAHLEPDVIVMDVSMPNMDGIEATRQIRQHNSRVRIVGLSMYGKSDVGAAMREAGADDYLSKTCAPHELIAAIRECAAA